MKQEEIQAFRDKWIPRANVFGAIFVAFIYFILRAGLPGFPKGILPFFDTLVFHILYKVVFSLIPLIGLVILIYVDVKTKGTFSLINPLSGLKHIRSAHFRPLRFILYFIIIYEIFLLIWRLFDWIFA